MAQCAPLSPRVESRGGERFFLAGGRLGSYATIARSMITHARGGGREQVSREGRAQIPARIATKIERTRGAAYPSPCLPSSSPSNGNRAGHRIQTERARRTRAVSEERRRNRAPGFLRGPARSGCAVAGRTAVA